MGEKMGMLEDNPNPAIFRFTIDIAGTVEDYSVIQPDMAIVGSSQACQQMHECGFSTTGWTKYSSSVAGERKRAVELEIPCFFLELNVELHKLPLLESSCCRFAEQEYPKREAN